MWNNWLNTTLKLTRVIITGELWLVVTSHCFMQSQFSLTVPRTFHARTGLLLELFSLCTLVTRNLTTKTHQREITLLIFKINVKLNYIHVFIFKNEFSFTLDKSNKNIHGRSLILNKKILKKHDIFNSIFRRIAWLTYF